MDKPVAIITGSAKRIGRNISLLLARNGYNIVIHYHRSGIDAQKTKKDVASCGADVLVVKADITSEKQVINMIQRTVSHFGKIDLLVNNAAVFPNRCDFTDLSDQIWDEIIGTNLKGTFLCSKFAATEMMKKKKGHIINIASLGAFLHWTGYIPYCVSKSGVVTLTKLLAKSLGPYIKVNAIAPGTIIVPNEENKSKVHIPSVKKILLKKYGKPSDIAEMILYLDKNGDYITGQVFCIDGGATIL